MRAAIIYQCVVVRAAARQIRVPVGDRGVMQTLSEIKLIGRDLLLRYMYVSYSALTSKNRVTDTQSYLHRYFSLIPAGRRFYHFAG